MQWIKAVGFFCLWAVIPAAGVAQQVADHVSQYGITWTFDKEYPVGQFVNGDWWVVGPVQVVSVTPEPGPSEENANAGQKSRYGATSMVSDQRMRNGSMVIEGPDYSGGDRTGFEKQGYDSRVVNYSETRTIKFPYILKADRSLISTISSEEYVDGKLSTPSVIGQSGLFLMKKTEPLALLSASVLTCLDKVPPPDAFRPPYAGTAKPIYRAENIRWDILPGLSPVASTPDWAVMARIYERPWLDHIGSWTIQVTGPGENGPFYGREVARLNSIAALMLLQDVSVEKKKALMIGYLQRGIDASGLAQCGRQWFSDGGHWQGRKWPILFASLMLGDEKMREFPPVDLTRPVYSSARILVSDAVPVPTTLFQEDLDYYYGKGGDGQTALWQAVWHTGARPPHQETPKAEMNKDQKFVDAYHVNNVAAQAGTALAVQLMGARALWNHDSFFDHIDWWMNEAVWADRPSWMPAAARKTFDPFIEDMWVKYRSKVPAQPSGKDNLKWVWKGADGCWEADSKPAAEK